MAPRWGNVYDILVHLAMVVDLECTDEVGRPLSFPFTWVHGAPDRAQTGQEVATEEGNTVPLLRPARSSCSADIWPQQMRHQDEDDDDEEDGRPGRHQVPQRKGLQQRLRWPSGSGRNREGCSSRQSTRQYDANRSLSPATRRSRERSLERMAHKLAKRTNRPDTKKKTEKAEECSLLRKTKVGTSVPKNIQDVSVQLLLLNKEKIDATQSWMYDPMKDEAELPSLQTVQAQQMQKATKERVTDNRQDIISDDLPTQGAACLIRDGDDPMIGEATKMAAEQEPMAQPMHGKGAMDSNIVTQIEADQERGEQRNEVQCVEHNTVEPDHSNHNDMGA